MNITSIPRLKDVLFALAAAGDYEQPLGRLPLQKIIYLADVLAPIWREVAKPSGFAPYKNGPYDKRIQNAVDALVFREIAQVSTPRFRRIDNIECQYSLTETGRKLVLQLSALEALHDDLELLREIAREVNRRGWQNIKGLVYAEPTYRTARSSGNAGRLRTDSSTLNLSREFLSDFRESLKGSDGQSVSRRNLVQMFFAVLSKQVDTDSDYNEEDAPV